MSGEIAFNMALGLPVKYRDDATFVNKVFPHIGAGRSLGRLFLGLRAMG